MPRRRRLATLVPVTVLAVAVALSAVWGVSAQSPDRSEFWFRYEAVDVADDACPVPTCSAGQGDR